jgi:hypothetical protein
MTIVIAKSLFSPPSDAISKPIDCFTDKNFRMNMNGYMPRYSSLNVSQNCFLYFHLAVFGLMGTIFCHALGSSNEPNSPRERPSPLSGWTLYCGLALLFNQHPDVSHLEHLRLDRTCYPQNTLSTWLLYC